MLEGVPGGSDGKESTWSVGDLGSIPGLGRSLGEGKGNPLQYSRASLVAQMVKNPPPMKEMWVRSLGREDPLVKEMVPTPVLLPGEFPGQRSLGGYSPWGHKELDTTERLAPRLEECNAWTGRSCSARGFCVAGRGCSGPGL